MSLWKDLKELWSDVKEIHNWEHYEIMKHSDGSADMTFHSKGTQQTVAWGNWGDVQSWKNDLPDGMHYSIWEPTDDGDYWIVERNYGPGNE